MAGAFADLMAGIADCLKEFGEAEDTMSGRIRIPESNSSLKKEHVKD